MAAEIIVHPADQAHRFHRPLPDDAPEEPALYPGYGPSLPILTPLTLVAQSPARGGVVAWLTLPLDIAPAVCCLVENAVGRLNETGRGGAAFHVACASTPPCCRRGSAVAVHSGVTAEWLFLKETRRKLPARKEDLRVSSKSGSIPRRT